MNKTYLNQSGQVFILAVIVLTLVMINTLLIISNSLQYSQNSRYAVGSIQATHLAEAGVDKAVASLNATGGNYTGEAETSLGIGTYSVTVTSIDGTTKLIKSTGYIPNKINPKVKRTVEIQVSKGIGASFNYGMQVGEGGLNMANNSYVNGSIYANNNIVMQNNAYITGDAYVAGGIQPVANQQSDCISPNCVDFMFGRTSNSQLDVAQSFSATASAALNKVSLKLKKVGSPSDLTVRLLADNNGSPNKNAVLASGTLTANLVTAQYGFADITFVTPPTITTDTTYWIMIDTSANSSNYWYWASDSTQGYTRGTAKWSPNWSASNPVWNSISGDLGFKVYMGGIATSITGNSGVYIGGDAYANTLSNIRVLSDAYYQTANNLTAGTHHPGSADPPAQVMPLSDANLQEWKDLAQSNGVFSGDITTCPATLASGKYVGLITLPSGCTVRVFSPIWVTGNMSFGGSDTIQLDSSLGASSGAFIVDGIITLTNNNRIRGSGTQGSYLMLISEFNSIDDPTKRDAIVVGNNGNSGILYTNRGSATISNNNVFTSVTAWKLNLGNNVGVIYDQGLAGTFFSSGPSGAFSAVKGTYQVK